MGAKPSSIWERTGQPMYQRCFKRAIDLIFAVLAMPFLLIILMAVGSLIYLQDRGSVFYSAPRLGRNGKTFRMHKFRSMKMNAPDIRNQDGSTFNAEDDPRLTPIGRFIRKTSLDEVPQVINIIKGEMSFVGPRPDLPEHQALYKGNECRKLEVNPGITGYSQAYYRNTIPWKERIQHDIYYIDHCTFLFDARILARTVLTVVARKNVFANTKSNG